MSQINEFDQQPVSVSAVLCQVSCCFEPHYINTITH